MNEWARAYFSDLPVLHGIVASGLSHVSCQQEGNGWAALTVGDFLLLAGEPETSTGAALLRSSIHPGDTLALLPEGWWSALAASGLCVQMLPRWAFRAVPQPEDASLRALLAELPDGFSLALIDAAWYAWCQKRQWAADFVSQFPTAADFARDGLGALLLHNGIPMAGASSYVSYPGGIEVQVQTVDGEEGHGFATLSAASLILHAHERGLRVTWDAANLASARVAEKLGYQPLGEYHIYALSPRG